MSSEPARPTPPNGADRLPAAAARRPSRPRTLATKGDEVEEWLDLHFFRPLGARITRLLYPTKVTPDQVTLVSLLIGLVAGHLFVYPSVSLNALGFALFIVSDLFDSADGQLARMRGTSTRFGRVLDGLSDTARFVNLGGHLIVRLAVFGTWSWSAATLLVLAAAISHSSQSAAVDFVRHAFLAVAVGTGSELDLDGVEVPPHASVLRRLAGRMYRAYGRRQARMFPRTVALVRAHRDHRLRPSASAVYRASMKPVLGECAWLGQNIRFIVLGATAVAGWPAGLLWITILPMNAILFGLVRAQERRADRVLRTESLAASPTPPPLSSSPPSSPPPPVVAVGGG